MQVERPPEPELETIDGRRVKLADNSSLLLDLPAGRVGGRFAAIEVRDGYFSGRTDQGQVIQTPVSQISAAAVQRPNNVGTVLWVAGGLLTLGLAALIVVGISTMPVTGVEGRPLRVRGRIVAAPAGDGAGWRGPSAAPDLSSLSPAGQAALADAWTETARAEHASVPAFARLSLTLVSLGAPARLVEAAHRAGLEEIEHARLAFALASAYAGEPVGPGALPELRTSPAVTAASLAELAHESLLDGCLNEGFSAAAARAAADRAGDPVVRDAWVAIARDESSHAELAWEVVTWCLDRAEPELGRRLRKAIHTTPASIATRGAPASLQRELDGHGWLPADERQDLFHETRLAVASRLAALIAERTRTAKTAPGPYGGQEAALSSEVTQASVGPLIPMFLHVR
jgi:hypothetical protein